MYHFHGVQLRVVRKHIRERENKKLFSGARFLILEHILPTTSELVKHFSEAGGDVFAIVAKPYSIQPSILSELEKKYRIIKESYDTLENTDILLDVLREAIGKSAEDKRPILVLDIGGYFAKPLIKLASEGSDRYRYIAGVVEDTTFGHNRYRHSIKDVPVPVFSVARSALKEIEARFVGRDAVTSMDMTLRDVGISISGRRALVLGYGMIGTNVARCLQANDLIVSVYDRYDHRNLQAFVDGFHIHKKRELLLQADIVFSATAERALRFAEIEQCRDNVILCSVGSKDTEFDVHGVKTHAVKTDILGDHLIRYSLPNSHHVIIAKEGTAVNFLLPSIPTEILDLVFSEITECFASLLKNDGQLEPGKIHVIGADCLSVLAKDWLIPMNQ